MQQAMRGMGPSPVPHIQHPPPNTSNIHQPQPRSYVDPSAAQIYEQQQRIIQQQQANQIQQAHRDHQMASHRNLGVQVQQHQQQMSQHTSIQQPQLPTRQMTGPGAGAPGRQVRPPVQTWPHPTVPGARISDQQMQQYQLHLQQSQQQQQGYAQTPQAQHQRLLEQHQQNQHHLLQQQQLQQQQHQQMSHAQIPAGYRMSSGPTPPQLVHAQPMDQQPQHLLRQQQQGGTSTPQRPPLAHALSYLETNSNPMVVNAQAGPSSAGPTMQSARALSRQTGRSASPMPPPSLPGTTPNMQASASASAIPSSSTLQPAVLPPRSSTLPLPAPAPRLPIGVGQSAEAGPSSAPSYTPLHKVRTLDSGAVKEESKALDPPHRLALRESISGRLKKHLERTEKQLLTAEKVERALKRRKLGGRSCKEMSKDEKWRGKFDDLVLEYLEKGGYQSAAEGLRADRAEKEVEVPAASVQMEKNLTDDSVMSGSRDGLLSGDSTLIEGDQAIVENEVHGEKEKEEKGKTSPTDGVMEVDPEEGAKSQVAVDVEKGSVDVSKQKEGDLGTLFTWYTVQRFASQITTTLNSSAVREFRIATDIADSHSFPLGLTDSGPAETELTLTNPAPTAPPTAQIPSSATATQIVVSAPHAAIRAASIAQDADRASQALIPPGTSPSGIAAQSPNELVGLTATFQKADTMRAAQEAQIRDQQAANLAAAEQARAVLQAEAEVEMEVRARARAEASGSFEPDEQRIEVQMGDQVVYMPQSEYHRLFAEEQNRIAQQHHVARSMGMVQQQPQHPQMMVQHQHPHQQHQMIQHQQHQQQQQHQMMMDGVMEGMSSSGSMKRGMDGEGSEGNKRMKMVRKAPTPEDHQRQAIEMATRARTIVPFMVPPGGSIQAATHRPGLPRHPSETDHQFAVRQAEWVRQVSAANNAQIQQNAYQQSFSSGLTPVSAVPSGAYANQDTPQTSGVGAGNAGLVPSPTVSRASHEKRPSAVGLGVADGEVTPTSARKKGGKRATKASAKGKKGKAGTPSSGDGPVTPFTIPETPVANIAHTPSHPPGEFQPSDAGGSSHDQEFSGVGEPTHQVDHQQHQQLQVQLLHNRQHPHLTQNPPSNPYHQQHHSLPYSHGQNPQVEDHGHGQFGIHGNMEEGGSVFEGMGLDDDLIKALGGYTGDQREQMAHQPPTQVQAQAPTTAGSRTGGGASLPQSATNFDAMGFDLDPNGGLNFDWDNVDFGNGDGWGENT